MYRLSWQIYLTLLKLFIPVFLIIFMLDYVFISKTLFFPKQGILAIGDLHIGYEDMLIQLGVTIPKTQTKETIEELKEIFKEIKKRKYSLKKIIFLGDIKHYFGFEKAEFFEFRDILDFLKENFEEKDIIFIRGNHDKFDMSGIKMLDYYIEDSIAFSHGHKSFPEIYDKKIKTIVISHIHPAVALSDKQGIKTEKFRCFLTGKFKGKEIIVVPHFFNLSDGTDVREIYSLPDFFIIPSKILKDFEIHVVGKDKIYNFGKVGRLK